LHNGFRPACRLRRGFFGNSDSISDHNSSSIIGLGIAPPKNMRRHKVLNSLKKYKPHFVRRS
jgi:hypothetical protein